MIITSNDSNFCINFQVWIPDTRTDTDTDTVTVVMDMEDMVDLADTGMDTATAAMDTVDMDMVTDIEQLIVNIQKR